MAKRRPGRVVEVGERERALLLGWARRRNTRQGLAARARIVLALGEDQSGSEVARRMGVSNQMVCKWRARFAAQGLDGLLDEPRPGAPAGLATTRSRRL